LTSDLATMKALGATLVDETAAVMMRLTANIATAMVHCITVVTLCTNQDQVQYPSKHIMFGESVALLVAHRTNNRKVVGSMPAKVVCITVLTGNRLG